MFNKEDEQLKKWKETIEKVEVPESLLEQAIKDGFNRAKKVKPVKKQTKYKRGIWSVVVAVILLLAFATSIRVSPAFANVISLVPGMEKLVVFIQADKGIAGAIQNEYYQELNISEEFDGVTFTLIGAIADEQEIVIFHSVKGANKYESFWLGIPELYDNQGNSLAMTTSSTPGSDLEIEQKGIVNIRYHEGVDESEFILKGILKSNSRSFDFEIPFSLAKEKMPTTRYPINEEVSIEGQKITIKKIEISPITVDVHISVDPDNTKKIFGFEDLRLVDDKGEAWTSATNGLTASGAVDDETIVYHLQSNYFEKPKGLTFMFNKLQAMDKEEAYLQVDTEKGEILKQPRDQRYSINKLTNGYFEFHLKAEKEYHSAPFNFFIDAEGKKVNFTSGGFSHNEEDGFIKITATFANESYVNPIKLPLFGYPQWIEGNVKIKIK